MDCIKCGTQNPENVNFCNQCGAPIPAHSGGTNAPSRSSVDDRPSPVQWGTPITAPVLLNLMAAGIFILGFAGAILAATSMPYESGKSIAGTFIAIIAFSLFYSGFLIGLSAIASRRR